MESRSRTTVQLEFSQILAGAEDLYRDYPNEFIQRVNELHNELTEIKQREERNLIKWPSQSSTTAKREHSKLHK